jgi:hypothetical protein
LLLQKRPAFWQVFFYAKDKMKKTSGKSEKNREAILGKWPKAQKNLDFDFASCIIITDSCHTSRHYTSYDFMQKG